MKIVMPNSISNLVTHNIYNHLIIPLKAFEKGKSFYSSIKQLCFLFQFIYVKLDMYYYTACKQMYVILAFSSQHVSHFVSQVYLWSSDIELFAHKLSVKLMI